MLYLGNDKWIVYYYYTLESIKMANRQENTTTSKTQTGLEPVKKIRLYENIVKQIQELIQKGELQPGERLPPERELAESLNVSRTSIREALRALEMMGYLESKVGVGGGTYIKEITLDNIMPAFSQLLLKDEDFITELLEVRLYLEIEVANLAALRRTEEDVQRMQEAIEQMEREVQSGESGLNGDNEFHKALTEAADNRVLKQFADMCGHLLEVEREEHLKEYNGESQKALKDHKKILEAVRHRDEDTVQELMRNHIHHISKMIKKRSDNNEG